MTLALLGGAFIIFREGEMDGLLEKIRSKKINFTKMHPSLNLNQEVVRLADIEEIFSNPIEPQVMPKAKVNVESVVSLPRAGKWYDATKYLPKTNEEFGESNEYLCQDKEFPSQIFVGWYNSKMKEWYVMHYKANGEPVKVSYWRRLPATPRSN